MKKADVFYWIVTVLFAGFMIFSAIPNVVSNPDSIKIFDHLGYPHYLLPFIGIAKILGGIVILLPGFNRLKEWAYAGLFFDLAGAMYSSLAVGDEPVYALFFVLFLAFLFLSYYLHHKRLKAAN